MATMFFELIATLLLQGKTRVEDASGLLTGNGVQTQQSIANTVLS